MKRRENDSRSPAKLLDHVRELQVRLLVSFSIVMVGGILGYVFYTQILDFLRSPLNAPLYYSTPAGSFAFIMKICGMVGVAVAVPVIIYSLVMFVRPAFKEVLTLRRVYFTTLFSIFLAVSGAAFGFIFIIPGALKFFAGFQVNGLSALISADSYLNFVINVLITFILVFQIPLLVTLIDRIKPIPPKTLFKAEKWVILASLIISLIVPFAFDIITCLLIAAPIVVLFNLSIILILWQHAQTARLARKHQKRARKQAPTFVTPQPVPTSSPAPVFATTPFTQTAPPPRPVARPSRPSMDIIRPAKATPARRSAPAIHPPTRPPAPGPTNDLRFISDIRS